MAGTRLHWLAIALGIWLTLFWNLGGPKLWDRDEPRNAGCAREMLARGDWVVPMFNDQLRSHKPALLYWAMMATYAAWGDNELGARMPSALAAALTVLATGLAGTRWFGRRTGRIAALVLGSTLMFTVAGRAATPDALLILCTTLALVMFMLVAFAGPATEPGSAARDDATATGGSSDASRAVSGVDVVAWPLFPRSIVAAAAIYFWMALGVLAKGPVAIVLPSAVIGMYLLIARSQRARTASDRWWRAPLRWFHPRNFLGAVASMRLEIAALCLILVAVPWYAWVGWRTEGAWLRGFFFEHNLSRAARPMEGHSGPIIYYPVVLLVGFFPWSVFAGPLIVRMVRSWRSGMGRLEAARLTFLVCWVAVFVGLFTIARTKLPSYVTPTYPAIAVMVAWLLAGWLERADWIQRGWIRASLATMGAVGAVLAIALPLVARRFMPDLSWSGLIGVPLLVGAGVAWWVEARNQRTAAFAAVAVASVGMVALTFGWLADRVSRHQEFPRMWAEALQAVSPDEGGNAVNVESHSGADGVRLLSYARLEPSWVYYARRPVEEVDRARRAELPGRMAGDDGATSILIVTEEDWRGLEAELDWSEHVRVLSAGPYFLRDERLLMVGRAAR